MSQITRVYHSKPRLLSNLMKWIIGLTIPVVLFGMYSLFESINCLYFISGFTGSETERGIAATKFIVARDSDTSLVFIGILAFISAISLFVLWLCWIYRANSEARAAGATNLKFTPAWTVLGSIIPIASFVWGYQILRELWQSSLSPNNWQKIRAPGGLLLLWIMSIIYGLLASYKLYLTRMVGSKLIPLYNGKWGYLPYDYIELLNQLQVVDSLIGIVTGIAWLFVVRTITKNMLSHTSALQDGREGL